ncbi:hypothetical protein FCV85_15215 [Vibrio sp. F13]|nr:hypothetical protein FCV85_15215 [Vibrio sp. F13]
MSNIRIQVEKLGWLISISLIIWFCYQSSIQLSIWYTINWSYDLILVLVGSIALYSWTLINGGLVSYYLLKSVGESRGNITQVVSINLVAQLAKYLPGNIAHHIGRVVLSEKLRMKRNKILLSMLIETIWVVGVVVILTLYHGIHQGNDFIHESSIQTHVLILSLTITTIVFGPKIFRHSFVRLYAWFLSKQDVAQIDELKLPTLPIVMVSLVTYLFNYLLLGAVISLVGGALFDLWELDILTLGSIFAVAWIVGFFTPGSPAGIGVRELVLVSLLNPIYGSEVSLAITMILRLTTISGDVTAWVIGAFMWSKSYTEP